MKIIKDAGECTTPLLPRRIATELRPILAVSGAGAALWQGSLILVRRGWGRLGAHFTGWERAGVLAFTGYVVVYSASHYPDVAQFAAPGAAATWCTAAWIVAPPVPRTTPRPPLPEDDEEPREALALDALAAVVRRVAGDRQGAHLADLLAEPELEGWEQADLKARFVSLEVPVEEFKLRLDGRQRVRDGVRLRDLPPPAPADPTPATPSGSPTATAPTAPLVDPADPAPQPDQPLTPEAG
ncbi:hypothetical protein [Streptomyces sp. NPDC021356]|uniref:hypothetical protein n=1 Tax=Streptomyces sp. NPDC021356 TaxID=3154900 RepID=UPI003403392F